MKCFVALTLLALGCGGDEAGETLISTSISGSAEGVAFDGSFGISTVLESGTIATVVGSGEVNCGDIERLPPSGIYVNIQIPDAVVGTPTEHFFLFSIIENGDLRGGGSSAGTINVTAISAETIAMTVDYSDTVNETMYAVSGAFEAIRCP